MKIAKNLKIELCTSTDASRYILGQPYLRGDYLVATDGRRLVRLKILREEGDTDGHITAAALKAARKTGNERDDASIECNGAYKLTDGTILPRDQSLTDSNYPNFEHVIPKEDYPHKFTFNAKMLWEMAQALGSDGNVTIEYKDPKAAIRVYSDKAPDGLGVLMPVRTT